MEDWRSRHSGPAWCFHGFVQTRTSSIVRYPGSGHSNRRRRRGPHRGGRILPAFEEPDGSHRIKNTREGSILRKIVAQALAKVLNFGERCGPITSRARECLNIGEM